jgi:hypothetical protein
MGEKKRRERIRAGAGTRNYITGSEGSQAVPVHPSSKGNAYNQLYGADRHSRGRQLGSHSILSEHFIEPEGSLPCSQQLSTFSYPEPDRSSSHHPILSLQDPC